MGGIGVGEISFRPARLKFCRNRLRYPRVLEAALRSGLNFSALSGYPDNSGAERMNLFDVAALSGETVIAQLLRERGMESNYFSREEYWHMAGKQFVELADDRTLAMDMRQIGAATLH